MKAEWNGDKLQINGQTIAEIKPHMEKSFKVVYADKPDLGPNQYGYISKPLAMAACEKKFGVVA